MSGRVFLGVDIGGTNTKVGLVDAGGTVRGHVMIETRAAEGAAGLVGRVGEAFERLAAEAGIARKAVEAVGVGSPGPLSVRRGVVIHAANLPGWRDVPLRDLFREALDRPVVLDNDANAACWGEYRYGAGRGVGDVVMLTLGTGIGGGVVCDGRLVHGHFENAGELGHMIVVAGGRACSCGKRGCLEAYASATAIARRAMEQVEGGRQSLLAAALQRGGIDAAAVAEAVTQGDALAAEVWEETCRLLAVGIVNLQHAFNPAVVILGGGVSEAGEVLLGPVREQFRREAWRLHTDFPEIRLAALGQDAGIIGAAALALAAVGD